jgi:glycosyltransferase involved in cell wall biosynthesis
VSFSVSEPRVVHDQRPSAAPPLSFLVPAYNEIQSIESVLEALNGFPEPHEIIVVDDGSTDGTREKLESLCPANTLVLFHAANGGKGAAVRTALARARGRFTAIQDADLEYDPLDYRGLLDVARRDNARAVFGSRFLRANPNIYRRFLWGNRLMTAWINGLTGARYTDTYTCYKLIESDLFRALALEARGFEMEAEICVKLSARGVFPTEVPIHYKPRRVEEGKKIGWRDFFKGVVTALKHRRAK